jgi:hypothetical protein
MRRKKDPIQNLIIVALSIILLIIVIPMFIPIGEPAQVLFKQTQEEELVVETQDTYIEFVETPFLDEVAQEVVMPTYEINVPLEWQEFGWDICQQHSFPYETWLAVMRQESGFNLKAVGINYAKDNKTILSKDLGLMGLNDRFKETHASAAGIPIDEFDYFNPYHNIKAGIIELVKTVLTKPRIEKLMYKLVDEGLLKEDYNIEDMGTILRALGGRVFEDIMKEESDLFVEYEEDKIKRVIGKNTPNIIKEVLKEQGRV